MSNRRSFLYLALVAVLFVVVPFLTWYGTWFGRPLSDREIDLYLEDSKKPRKIQHALWQLALRIQRGDATARRWYPRVCELASSPVPELRTNVAWALGQDNRSEEFHRALVPLLQDPEPLVRRNAALSLVRFRDPSGKPELLAMLQPFTVRAPRAGTLAFRLKEDEAVGRGTLLARISTGATEPVEVRSPLPGRFQGRLAKDGARVAEGDPLLLLAPAGEQVWEALRALYLVGAAEDLPEVERFARGVPGMPERVQQQARLTVQAIRSRG